MLGSIANTFSNCFKIPELKSRILFTMLVLAICRLAAVTHIDTYYEISAVAIAGLFGDLVATWMFNAVIVLFYIERGGSTGDEKKPFLSSVFSS